MNENIKIWTFSFISWGFGLTFLLMGFINLGINTESVNLLKFLLILIGFSLIIFPFISKLKIGNLLELERKIESNNAELSEFKSFVSSSLNILSTNMNSIKNDVKFELHFPTFNELKNLTKQIEDRNNSNSLNEKVESNKIELQQETTDKTWALIKTRIDIEKKLRLLLGKKTQAKSFTAKEIKFLSLDYLIRTFIESNPGVIDIKESFDYYRRIVNSVIHGQIVDDIYIDEAIELGVQLKTLIENVSE
jgi:hypothetical protein